MTPHRTQEFLASIGDLTGLLSLEEGTDQALQRVTDIASRLVLGADGVGITLVAWNGTPHPKMRTAAYTDDWVKAVDLEQYGTSEGPCVDAIMRGEVVRMTTTEDTRYPNFSRGVVEMGLGSVLAAPLQVNNKAVGALNLYARRADAFDQAAEEVACNFAAHAAIALVNIELYEGARNLGKQLSDAMESRAVIEQAKGILMGRSAYSADEAFAELKTMSQNQNLKLAQVAVVLVEGAGSN